MVCVVRVSDKAQCLTLRCRISISNTRNLNKPTRRHNVFFNRKRHQDRQQGGETGAGDLISGYRCPKYSTCRVGQACELSFVLQLAQELYKKEYPSLSVEERLKVIAFLNLRIALQYCTCRLIDVRSHSSHTLLCAFSQQAQSCLLIMKVYVLTQLSMIFLLGGLHAGWREHFYRRIYM